MAKRNSESKFDLKKYAGQVLSIVAPLVVENRESIVRKIDSIVNYKRFLKRYAVLAIVLLIALFLLLNGLVLFIGSLFPGLVPGTVHIFIGLFLVLIAIFYARLWKL
jgi:hypothetical protein